MEGGRAQWLSGGPPFLGAALYIGKHEREGSKVEMGDKEDTNRDHTMYIGTHDREGSKVEMGDKEDTNRDQKRAKKEKKDQKKGDGRLGN